MKVIIVSGGVSILTAGYHFRKTGFKVTIYEEERKIN